MGRRSKYMSVCGVARAVVDSGVENISRHRDELVKTAVLRRILALIEVAFSNSTTEACWRYLRHQWLYLHMLESLASLMRLIAFCIEQHGTVTSYSTFLG